MNPLSLGTVESCDIQGCIRPRVSVQSSWCEQWSQAACRRYLDWRKEWSGDANIVVMQSTTAPESHTRRRKEVPPAAQVKVVDKEHKATASTPKTAKQHTASYVHTTPTLTHPFTDDPAQHRRGRVSVVWCPVVLACKHLSRDTTPVVDDCVGRALGERPPARSVAGG